MIRRYGIAAEERPLEPPSPDLYRAFADFGYGECLDAFLGFGVFKIARHSGLSAGADVRDFRDPDARGNPAHRLFCQLDGVGAGAPRARRPRGCARRSRRATICRAIGRLLGTVRRGQAANDGKDFSATQASVFLDGFSLRGLVAECCAEHARRMAGFDPDLLQPRFLPRLAGGRAGGPPSRSRIAHAGL